jgi:hypothetical protein
MFNEFVIGLGRLHFNHVDLCADRRVSDQGAMLGAGM